MLRIQGLARQFGGVYAVRNLSLSIDEGELRGLIGPNGAGKSTLFNLISGHLAADAGVITFKGKPIQALAPHERARRGIAIVFQGARLFRGMTVRENVMVGAHARTRQGFLAAALRLRSQRREEAEIGASADRALESVGLSDWADRAAEALPLGQQRSLQVARALCANPALLLLDEPASGLRAAEREVLAQLLEKLRSAGLMMILIEHDVPFVARLVDRISVLHLGELIAEGSAAEVRSNKAVVDAYLGRSTEK